MHDPEGLPQTAAAGELPIHKLRLQRCLQRCSAVQCAGMAFEYSVSLCFLCLASELSGSPPVVSLQSQQATWPSEVATQNFCLCQVSSSQLLSSTRPAELPGFDVTLQLDPVSAWKSRQ